MPNYISYTTKEGDTFDILALHFYNDEFQAHQIMGVNPNYIHYISLPPGIILRIPVIEAESSVTLPPWKR